MSGFNRILDRFAIGLSSLCLVHCLAAPLMLLLLPAAGLGFALPESFHIWMLLNYGDSALNYYTLRITVLSRN
ncbi:MAG: MerC family mercury resistance protein [Sphingomonadaceae bacterium]|nr:MerC family mercury resistance protein [Sphingomonadaceae bacterium]